MLVKVIGVFLLAMVAVGMIGKALFPSSRVRKTVRKAATCPSCGRPQIGRTCDCKGPA